MTTAAGGYTFAGLPPGGWKVAAKIGAKTMDSVLLTLVAGRSGNNGDGATITIDVPAP